MISSPRVLRVYVPMRRYRLRLFHCLLSELGSVSHALIRGMGRYELAYADSARVVGLNEAQLAPIARRLKALDILDDANTLTSRGRHLAEQLGASHERDITVWLSARTKGPVWLAVEGQSRDDLHVRPGADGVEWSDRDFPGTDGRAASLQRVRLRDHLAPVIAAGFSEAARSLATRATSARDWDLRVDVDTTDRAARFIAIDVPLDALTPGKGRALTLACELTTLAARHDTPERLPAGVRFSCPATMRWGFDHAMDTLDSRSGHTGTPTAHPPRTSLRWPSVNETDRARVAEMLLAAAADDLAGERYAASRTMSFGQEYVLRGLDWRALSHASDALPGIHCLGAKR